MSEISSDAVIPESPTEALRPENSGLDYSQPHDFEAWQKARLKITQNFGSLEDLIGSIDSHGACNGGYADFRDKF